MKKLVILLLLLSSSVFIQAESDTCPAGAPSWRTANECSAENGRWIVSDSECNKYKKWLGKKQTGMVCCADCTAPSLQQAGMD